MNKQNIWAPAMETMPVEERESFYNTRLQETITLAYNETPAFKKRLDDLGLSPDQIRSAKDLTKIPILRKDNFIEQEAKHPPLGGYYVGDEPRAIFVSPGPIYEPQNSEEQIEVGTKALYAAGFRKGDIALVTFSFHMVPAGFRTIEHLDKIGVTWVPTGVGNVDLQLEVMRDLKVNCYTGTPSFLILLIKRAEELGHNFVRDYNLERAWFVAEMLPQDLRDVFENDYKINTYQAYGTGELGIVAYECEEKAGWHIPEELIIEVVDPDTDSQLMPGEIGEVAVTLLHNTYPLIRYGTGDLSSLSEESCPCGRTSAKLDGIVGRVGEAVKVRGMFIHPRQVHEVIKGCEAIGSYQVKVRRQEHRDQVIICAEINGPETTEDEISKSIAGRFKDICRVNVDQFEFLPRGTISPEAKRVVDERVWD